jgi:preprotein translocase subunit SecA
MLYVNISVLEAYAAIILKAKVTGIKTQSTNHAGREGDAFLSEPNGTVS